MLLPETKALRTAMNALPPDVVLDAHEFTVANRWLTKFGAIQAVDALLLEATHPNVRGEVTALARTLFRPQIEAALKAHGLSSFDYYTTTLESADKVVAMGGNAPGTARNAFGLHNAVSFLIESRGDDADAGVGELHADVDHAGIEELYLVDADHLHPDLHARQQLGAGGDRHRLQAPVVARDDVLGAEAVVDERFEDLHALARDDRAAQAPDQLLRLSGEHASSDDLNPAAFVTVQESRLRGEW
jgi:hypothetical protein